MKITGRVVAADGTPLAAGKVDVVVPRGAKLVSIGEGTVKDGTLSAEPKNAAVWAVRIDGRPIVTTVASFDGETVDLGEITMAAAPVRWPVFHAPDGMVFGTPFAAAQARSTKGFTTAAEEPARALATSGGLTVGNLMGSTAQQISSVVTASRDVQLTNASITIKGVPSATGEAISIEFPTAELAATGTGLSEVSFTVKPLGLPPITTPEPAGPPLPDLRGYTRDLAIRKLAALRLVAEVRDEFIPDQTKVGRVVRQIPAAGQSVSSTHVVQVFIGKLSGA